MSADGKHVYAKLLWIDIHFSIRLDCIYMNQCIRILFLNKLCSFCNRLDGSDFIIYLHEGNQNGIRPDCPPHLLQGNRSLVIYRKVSNLITILFQISAGS